jgi:hypothetical protein
MRHKYPDAFKPLTGYTDAQARRADIAAQIVGMNKTMLRHFGFPRGGLEDMRELIAAYEATFDAPTEHKEAV